VLFVVGCWVVLVLFEEYLELYFGWFEVVFGVECA